MLIFSFLINILFCFVFSEATRQFVYNNFFPSPPSLSLANKAKNSYSKWKINPLNTKKDELRATDASTSKVSGNLGLG